MNVKDLLKAWEEGIAGATAPALKRREEVSQADLGEHMHGMRIRTHLQTGQFGTYGVSWNKGCLGADRLMSYGAWGR